MSQIKAEIMTEAYIKKDRLRYVKNKLSGNLAIISIVFNALFFVSIYKSNVGQYYYKPLIGASIVYNLLFMMIVFLVSEGSKNYSINYSYIAIPVAVLQFARIFVYPMMGHRATTLTTGVEEQVMKDGQFIRVVIYLIASGVFLLLSAFIGIVKCKNLQKHIAEIEANN
ncbi:MAG: hypothetical protein K5669_04830 [Lachnospiraceae bacterium]|nr:hypothetical protein [Lachnospiraceae bacterium]